MAIPIFQRTIVNESGDILAGAAVTVTNSSTGLPATIYSDRSGTALDNPFTSDSNGLATFYADPDEYNVSATDGTATIEWLNFAMTGTAALSNSGTGTDEIPKNSDLGTASLSDVMVDGDDTEDGKVLTVGATARQLDKTNSNIKYETTSAATLKSDFAKNEHYLYKGLDDVSSGDVTIGDIWTHSRATSGTGISGNLSLQTASVDTPRIVFDPDNGEGLGYLSEKGSTRINTIGALPTVAEDITVTAQEYTVSFYGAGTITLSGAYSGTLVGSSSYERVSLTFTAIAGTLTSTPNGTVENLQIEAGSLATSVILGEGSTVTRSADSMVRTLGNEWNQEEGTIVVELSFQESTSVPSGIVTDGLGQSWLYLINNRIRSYDGANARVIPVDISENQLVKVAISSDQDVISMCLNGGEGVVSGGTTGNLTRMTELNIFESISDKLPGNIKYLEYYPKALTDEELKELTKI